MKKLFLIFIALIMVVPAFAANVSKTDADKSKPVSAYYVKEAYNALETAKQEKLTTSNVTQSGSGPVVTDVTASNGTVTVTKSEVTVPVGSASSPTDHATIWIQ